jgi:hypothetical protein
VGCGCGCDGEESACRCSRGSGQSGGVRCCSCSGSSACFGSWSQVVVMQVLYLLLQESLASEQVLSLVVMSAVRKLYVPARRLGGVVAGGLGRWGKR